MGDAGVVDGDRVRREGGEESGAPGDQRQRGDGRESATAPVDYLGAVGAAQKQAQRFGDLNPVQQAVRTFKAGEDRMPANLQELVTEGYLPKLPVPPKGFVLVMIRDGQTTWAPAPGGASH